MLQYIGIGKMCILSRPTQFKSALLKGQIYQVCDTHTHTEKRERWIDLETPEKQWYDSSSKSDRLKTQKEPIFPFESEGKKQKQKQKKPQCPCSKAGVPSSSWDGPLFSSSQALDKAHPHQRGQSALLSLLIQILMPSRNTFIGTARMPNYVFGHPMAQ